MNTKERKKSYIINGWEKSIESMQNNLDKYKRELAHIPQSTFKNIPGGYVAMRSGIRWWLPYSPESAKLLDKRLKSLGFTDIRRSDEDSMHFTLVTYTKLGKKGKLVSRIEVMYAYETEGTNCIRQKIGTKETDVYEVICDEAGIR